MPVSPSPVPHPAHRLYDMLAADGDDAHGRYNALVRRLVSFARAAEHASAIDPAAFRGRVERELVES